MRQDGLRFSYSYIFTYCIYTAHIPFNPTNIPLCIQLQFHHTISTQAKCVWFFINKYAFSITTLYLVITIEMAMVVSKYLQNILLILFYFISKYMALLTFIMNTAAMEESRIHYLNRIPYLGMGNIMQSCCSLYGPGFPSSSYSCMEPHSASGLLMNIQILLKYHFSIQCCWDGVRDTGFIAPKLKGAVCNILLIIWCLKMMIYKYLTQIQQTYVTTNPPKSVSKDVKYRLSFQLLRKIKQYCFLLRLSIIVLLHTHYTAEKM